jgi:hypothetical protein
VFTYCPKNIRKEALWLVSNIAANSEEDANAVADSQVVLNLILSCRDNTIEVRKEAVWAISNICHSLKDKNRLERLLEFDIMAMLLDMLQRDHDSGPIC